MWDLDWTMVGSAAAAFSALATPFGIVFLIRQINCARQVASADFVLRLERDFANYVDTYQKLRPNGPWDPHHPGPADEADLVKLVSYLNFFASLHVIIRNRFLDLHTVNQMFAYRFFIAMHSPHIIGKIIAPDRAYWGQVLALYGEWMKLRHRLGKKTPQEKYAALLHPLVGEAQQAGLAPAGPAPAGSLA